MRTIDLIVIHCSAWPNGEPLSIEKIDEWHGANDPPFNRNPRLIGDNRPDLKHIGYHYFIGHLGATYTGRGLEEMGAHVRGHNARSIGICMSGTDAYRVSQWAALRNLVCASIATIARRRNRPDTPRYRPQPAEALDLARRMDLRICGHRDLSPDLNGDGTIEAREWVKTCPGFDVSTWLAGGMEPLAGHIVPHEEPFA